MDGCEDLCKHAFVNEALEIWCGVRFVCETDLPYRRCTFVYHIDRSVPLTRPKSCAMRGLRIACDQTNGR